jgi:hypothetical protein
MPHLACLYLLPLQVGVVSDYDLLALDKLGTVKNDKQLFPAADETWQVGPTAAVAAAVATERAALVDCVGASVHWLSRSAGLAAVLQE